jgi:signal transduction histidine kinase
VWSAAVLVGALYLLTVPFIESYPTPSPYASCHAACPPNAFLLGGSEPQFIDSVIEPLREVLTVLLFLGVTARLAGRWQASSGLMRRTLAPVLIVASVSSVAIAVGLGAAATSESNVPGWLSWTIALTVPAVALAFLLGLLSSRLHSARALEQLGADVRAHLTPAKLRRQLADALEDPSLRLFLRVGVDHQAWVDELGVSVGPPAAGPGQHVTDVRDGDRVVGVIVHDAALGHDRDFLRAVASFAVIALMNEQLTETVASALRDVRESRARIVASADRERKRIERDLHDGAQQRLVALRVQLELTEELVKHDRTRGLEKLHSLGPEVDATLDDIRALARGVYPPLLADRGLADALGAAALKLSLPTTVSPDGAAGRYPSDVESAIFFCCLEAMQNASKHARGAHHVDISLSQEDAIRFEVKDDGAGFDIRAIQAGLGLTNMTDRIAAVGGKLTITSTPGQGTVVSGSVPLTAAWAHQNGKEDSPPGPTVVKQTPVSSRQAH